MFIFRTGLNELNKMHFVAAKQMWMHLKDNDMRLLKYWIEAYLSNVGALYFGYKDKKGMIREPIECLKLRDIPKVVEMFIDKFVYFVNRKKCFRNAFGVPEVVQRSYMKFFKKSKR